MTRFKERYSLGVRITPSPFMSKPRDTKESRLRSNRLHPHTCGMTGSVDKGVRIAHRRWKQALSKHARRQNKPTAADLIE